MISSTLNTNELRIMHRNSEEIKNKDDVSMLSRRQARRLALQVLFCNEFLQEDINSVAYRVSSTLEHEINDFSRELIIKTGTHRNEIDHLILTNLKDKDIERVALLDKILIRLALCELLYFKDIPAEVTINEALELSKEFISNRSSRFINGVLDSVLRELERENRINKGLISSLPSNSKKNRKTTKGIKQ